MASQELMSYEALEVFDLIKKGKNFLLSGGAGSGKTYSLVEIVNAVIRNYPLSKIACITFTNAAVNEIIERVGHPNLQVSTIHEFLWGNIKNFQKELKITLIELINDESCSAIKLPENKKAENDLFDNLDDGIQYKEFLRINEGIISHDELIVVAHKMYEKYDKLCEITTNCFPYIFVDEYQDTDKNVVEILLKHLAKAVRPNVVGFFGDAMQSIYDDGIGNLDDFKGNGDGQVHEVKKEQNRRNPKLIIDLANNLRNDGLIQRPSDDNAAPNIDEMGNVKEGKILFLYSTNANVDKVKSFVGWDFTDSKQTKELNLTHNLIAGKAGFEDLMRIYDGDKILDYVKRVKGYIKNNAIIITTEDKTFKEVVDNLLDGKQKSEQVKILPTAAMKIYIEEHPDNYQRVQQMPYDEISSIYVNKDQLIDDKKNDTEDEGKAGSNADDLRKHLFKIQNNLRLYQEKRFNEFLIAVDFKVSSIQTKIQLKTSIDALVNVENKTIGQVIIEADASGIVKIDDRLSKFKNKKRYIYDQVAELPFTQFQKLYEYLEGFTPFSTQHKTKGLEFSNVLVILDNGNWNNYNFEYLFTERKDKESVLQRTRKIFYVCCTRAKENLAVFYYQPLPAVIEKAKNWFGEENVVDLDQL
ncbi:ATP-dependent helicase [Methylovulum psychrotolerans]|uniref:ATP-dependent helicase n=1 Tax=Methylovulum psychrotolerans TaxID=1704499 RepID=UPI001BFF68F6|nr:ATP-dependent helicase [Methylovulum psychrotolerans]MBT9097485.1 ATP-dependent helicase [Methylovulum psychrotolerans]